MMYAVELHVWFGTSWSEANRHIGFWATKKFSLPFIPCPGLEIRFTKGLKPWVEEVQGLDFTISSVIFNVDSGEFVCDADSHKYQLHDDTLKTITEDANLIEKAGFQVEREGELRPHSHEVR